MADEPKKPRMTIEEAICIRLAGWRGEERHKLYLEALDLVHETAHKTYLRLEAEDAAQRYKEAQAS